MENRKLSAVGMFLTIWGVGTGITLVFRNHVHNPFEELTSLVPVVVIPFVMALYAAVLIGAWLLIPTYRFEFINFSLSVGSTVIGGLFAPHTLTALAQAFQ